MKYSNLEKSPNFIKKSVDLIENSFEYTQEHSFTTDFYPLMKESNHKNCHILIDNEEVVAHIGVLTREIKINKTKFKFTMLGGIAVSQAYRGQGLFKKLFNEVQNHYNNQAFYLLWSEKADLYKKFNFHLCGQLNQYESAPRDSSYILSSFQDLSHKELSSIKKLYRFSNEIRPLRSEQDWEDLKKMVSIDLYIKKNDQNILENYFLKNKGADLTDIIHEYGFADEAIAAYGKLWSPQTLPITPTSYLNAFLLKPGDNFKLFLKNYCKIEINNFETNSVDFTFNKESYQMSMSEFLGGVFGPGRFKELNSPFLFIPGATSI